MIIPKDLKDYILKDGNLYYVNSTTDGYLQSFVSGSDMASITKNKKYKLEIINYYRDSIDMLITDDYNKKIKVNILKSDFKKIFIEVSEHKSITRNSKIESIL